MARSSIAQQAIKTQVGEDVHKLLLEPPYKTKGPLVELVRDEVGVALDDAKRAGVDDGEEQMRRAHEERAPAAGRAAAGADDAAEGQPDQDEAGGAEAGHVQRVAEGEEEDCG